MYHLEGAKRFFHFFRRKIVFQETPFVQICLFLQNGLFHHLAKLQSDRTSRLWEKWHILMKLGIFQKCIICPKSELWGTLEPNGFDKVIQCGPLCLCAKFQETIFLHLRKKISFFGQILMKTGLKKHQFSRKLRDFWHLVRLVKFCRLDFVALSLRFLNIDTKPKTYDSEELGIL